MWKVGIVMSLEAMRRGFIGGTCLSLFVIKEFGLERQGKPTLEFLRKYLDIEEDMLSLVPPGLDWVFTIFSDYHESAKTYLAILDDMVELQCPSQCSFYWKE